MDFIQIHQRYTAAATAAAETGDATEAAAMQRIQNEAQRLQHDPNA